MNLHSDRSRNLIRQVDQQLSTEHIDGGSLRANVWIQGVQSDRALLLKKMIKGGAFIRNDTIDRFVNAIFDHIRMSNNLPVKDRTVMIVNTPEVNAFCYGPGLFFVTVGLLGRINSEEELAFILAHELAHDELHHIEQKIVREAYNHFTRQKDNTLTNILGARDPEEEITMTRNLLYSRGTFSRECELQADAMGLSFLTNAGYSSEGAIIAMSTLDNATNPKQFTPNLFKSFQFAKFPFKDHWLDERLTVYNHRPGDTYFLNYDSILSHPELDARKVALQGLIHEAGLETHDKLFPNDFQDLIVMSEFQTVEAAYMNSRYDWALYKILQLQRLYPANPYLVSREAKMMLDLFEAKNENRMVDYAARFTTSYGPQLKEVNNFLFNLSKEEIVEVAFHIVNNQSNFNKDDKSHYYLLWQICSLSEREQVKHRIEAAYEVRFGKKVNSYDYR